MFSIISATMMAAAMPAKPVQIEMELAPNGQRILCYIDEYQSKRQAECKNTKPRQEKPKNKNRTKA
jgi:hypothetical protein